jgi:hypothetical protein
MNTKKYFIIGLLFFSLIAGLSQVFSEDISGIIKSLFSQEQRRTEYSEVYDPLLSVFIELEQQDLPTASLIDKLKEGFAKKVSPERLLTGIKNEATRVKKTSELMKRVQFICRDENEKKELFRNISLFLLGGLPEDMLESMLRDVRDKEQAVKTVQSLGTTILKLKNITGLNDTELSSLSNVLLNSALNYSSYPMITSLFVKAKFRRISDQEMFLLVVNILKRGGGILQIEEELSRRTKR